MRSCAPASRLLPATRNSKLATTSPAFTFIEILFAVILLGIGFIMIAAVFPVAIQQTSAVSDETQGTAVARDAIKKIQAVADSIGANALFPVTGTSAAPGVVPFGNSATQTPLFQAVNNTASNVILNALGSDAFFSADRRYGWVGFYRRDSATSPFVQVYVIALENPNFPNYILYNAGAPVSPPTPVPPPIPPDHYGYSPTYAVGTAGIATVQFVQDPNGNWYVECPALGYAATGCFLIPAAGAGNSGIIPPQVIGRFFRLGAPVPYSVTPQQPSYYLQPGWDIGPTETALATALNANPTAVAFIIGRAPAADASNGYTGAFTGPVQDIGAATGFVRINTANN